MLLPDLSPGWRLSNIQFVTFDGEVQIFDADIFGGESKQFEHGRGERPRGAVLSAIAAMRKSEEV